ncbi:hypothetical protein [Thermomonas sp. HDW16]|uniref:hypothetical protein n=1 Tax=Thermomonas sp. HDW16 TaxID=2714945 RepID=UPI00140CF163|nr:hypothetical protein [Thermomonas sp. HDW16]QIL20066.1 hypothetical protein G7079_04570 [Thermomonas sp. HDW16]
MRAYRSAFLLCCCLLAACGGDKSAAGGASGEDGLPKPAAASGSVTGMPNPGVAVAHPAADSAQVPVAEQPPATNESPIENSDATAPIDQADDAQQAMSVLRNYYAAINARDLATAYALWGDGGRASGQTPQQFAAGFSATSGVSMELGTPGRIEGAAGSRYIEIPLTLETRQADGSLRRYAGTYTLRRSVVDGATPAQQSWHIASADLRAIVQ